MATLVLTPGDPTGIGPEITVKALARLGDLPPVEFVVVGSMDVLEGVASDLGKTLPKDDRVRYVAIEADQPGTIAYNSLDAAVKMIAAKEADALVTGPINKHNLKTAGINFPGHTEILEKLAQEYISLSPVKAEMLFVYKQFRLLLLTRHIALKDVPAALAKQGAVAGPLKILINFLRTKANVSEPRIAILGINPHAGEIAGEEEKKLFTPIINAVNNIGNTQLAGPFAADGFFRGFDAEKPGYDAIVAAYHDQGLIPFKLLAGHEAVNVTIGLPFIRTSVSHGTADDIAGKGIANEDSLIAAIRTATEMI
jgi:4-hydroxythreonine-4-phosphate dehydrogenase